MYEIKPIEWRPAEGWRDGTIEANTVGGLLRCAPWRSDSGETGVDWHHVAYHGDDWCETVASNAVDTLDAARAKCEQIHRDLVSAWLVPAGQVMELQEALREILAVAAELVRCDGLPSQFDEPNKRRRLAARAMCKAAKERGVRLRNAYNTLSAIAEKGGAE